MTRCHPCRKPRGEKPAWKPAVVNGFVYRQTRRYHLPGIYKCPICSKLVPTPSEHHWTSHPEASTHVSKQGASQ